MYWWTPCAWWWCPNVGWLNPNRETPVLLSIFIFCIVFFLRIPHNFMVQRYNHNFFFGLHGQCLPEVPWGISAQRRGRVSWRTIGCRLRRSLGKQQDELKPHMNISLHAYITVYKYIYIYSIYIIFLYLHLCLEDVERACSSPVFLCICHLWISWLWCPPFILAEFVSPWFVRTKSGSADHHRQNDTTPSSFSVWSFEISSTTFLSWSVNGQHLHLGVIKTLLASLSFCRKSCWGTVSQVHETWHTYSTYLVDPSTYTS